jgi:phospholipid-binding lipoprotein MlaA
MRPVLVTKLLPLLAVLMLASACSTCSNEDPIEPFNRAVFKFNEAVDTVLLKPVAQGYRYITPQPIRNSVGNVFSNLTEPFSMANSFLQGDFTQGMTSFWRFVINSTIGLAGINDVASSAGIRQQREDLGQTFAVWGVGTGPYLILPILGPSNGRDAVGLVASWFTDPVNIAINDNSTQIGLALGNALVIREQLLDPIDDIYSSSLDPYASFRSIYQQRRAAEIKNQRSDVPRL